MRIYEVQFPILKNGLTFNFVYALPVTLESGKFSRALKEIYTHSTTFPLPPAFLFSFAYMLNPQGQSEFEQWLEIAEKRGVYVFVDSGAFTEYIQKVRNRPTLGITVDSYAKFLSQYAQHIDVAFELDVIGDPEASYKQFLELMEYPVSSQIPILPVMHWNAPWGFLDKLSQYPYIALSPRTGLPAPEGKEKVPDLQVSYASTNRWVELCTKSLPHTKVHLLGYFSRQLFSRAKIFSADRSVRSMATGKVVFGASTLYISERLGAAVDQHSRAEKRISDLLERPEFSDLKGWADSLTTFSILRLMAFGAAALTASEEGATYSL